MGKRVIRLGDPTTHGGTVVGATTGYIMFGKEVAGIGDKATCPIPGHGTVVIVEGDPAWTVNGKNVALEGHKCSCGCSLISTLPNVVRMYEGEGVADMGAVGGSDAARLLAISSLAKMQASAFDEQTHLNTNGNAELTGLPYYVETSDGRTLSGRAEELGVLPRVVTDSEDEYSVFWGDEALVRMGGQKS